MLSLESCLHRRSHEDLKTMPWVQEVRHPKSLDLKKKQKAVLLRETGCTWDHIRGQVRNLQGDFAICVTAEAGLQGLQSEEWSASVLYNYQNCGQKPTKVTKTIEKFLVQRLLALRQLCTCTATTLQREVLAAKGVSLDVSTIRKILSKRGFQWLPKAQKRKYNKRRKQERLAFAKAVLRLTKAELREKPEAFAVHGRRWPGSATQGCHRQGELQCPRHRPHVAETRGSWDGEAGRRRPVPTADPAGSHYAAVGWPLRGRL